MEMSTLVALFIGLETIGKLKRHKNLSPVGKQPKQR